MSMNGDTAKIMKANIQLAVKAMTSPAVIVAMFWTISAEASPTMLRIVEASVDSLAPIAALQSEYKIVS